MLLSLVLRLTPLENGTLPLQTGRAIHGWFLRQIESLDAGLSSRLHQPNELRPFTVSDLWQGTHPPQRVRHCAVGEGYWLRITSVEPNLSQFLLQDWLPTIPLVLELGGAKFALLDKITKAQDHLWAAECEYDELVAMAISEVNAKQFALEFVSPTVFRSNKQLLPFPIPRLVFEGLATSWNQWSGLPFADALQGYIADKVVVEEYRLRTMAGLLATAGAVREYGCVGQCVYKMMGRNDAMQGAIRCLAAFTFFAGVGKHTAMGLGQVRKVTSDGAP